MKRKTKTLILKKDSNSASEILVSLFFNEHLTSVFYSVLVAQASLFDWITTVSAMIAVTTGLAFTIFLLVVYERPLPALPISIALGVVFYFGASVTLSPMLFSFVSQPDFNGVGSGLFVGTDGSGFMFI